MLADSVCAKLFQGHRIVVSRPSTAATWQRWRIAEWFIDSPLPSFLASGAVFPKSCGFLFSGWRKPGMTVRKVAEQFGRTTWVRALWMVRLSAEIGVHQLLSL